MFRRNLTKSFIGCVAALGIVGAAHAAENWPARPIQIVVPFGAGGDTDFNARILAKYLEPELGVSMPVVNITGAGGTVAARQVKDAKPDGQTTLFFHTTFLSSQALGITDLTLDDYELVGIVAREDGNVIVVSANSPYKTMKELMAAAAANPGSIDLTANTGASTYLLGSMLNNAGGEFNFVDVGGAAGRLTAVLGGNVDVSFNPVGQVKPYVDKGELRALATVSNERTTSMPDLPTLKELGYDIQFRAEYFFLLPKGTPSDVIQKMGAAAQKVINNNKDYSREIKAAYSQKPFFMPSAEAKEYLEGLLKGMKAVKF